MSINGDPKAALTTLLNKMVEMGGSDLHIRVDSPPQVRLHGQLAPLEGYESLTPEDTQRLAFSFLSETQRQHFDDHRELDFSIGLEGLSRFRVNIFNQKETVGGVFQNDPLRDPIVRRPRPAPGRH
jgi:twitching motility protein PilT